jgi:hypothetical protein
MCASGGLYFSALVLKPFDYTHVDHFTHISWMIWTYLMTWKTMDWKQDHFEMFAVMTVGACEAPAQ